MSFSMRKASVLKRCSSSYSSGKHYERDFLVERPPAAKSRKEKVRKSKKGSYEQRSWNGFMESPDSAWVIPDEEKVKNRRNNEHVKDSQKTHRRGLLIENAGGITDCESIEAADDEAVDKMTQRMFRTQEPSDEWDFAPPIANSMSENADGRRSRKGFTRNYYQNGEHALTEETHYSIPTDNCDVSSRARKVSTRRDYCVDDHTLAEDIRYSLHVPADRSDRSMSARYCPMSRPKKNNFLKNDENSGNLRLEEDIHFILDDTTPDDSSTTSIPSGNGAVPRPKKKDSTRKPNFTDDIMLSGDIDHILEEEVGEFDSTSKLASKLNGAVLRQEKAFHQKQKLTHGSKLAKDIQYILSDENVTDRSSNGLALRARNKNSTRRMCDDDNKAARNMDTIIEEDVKEINPSTTTKFSRSGFLSRSHNNGVLSPKKMYSSSKAIPSNHDSAKSTRVLKKFARKKRNSTSDITMDKDIKEILTIPVLDSSISLEDKMERILCDSHTKQKPKRSSLGTKSKLISSSKAVVSCPRSRSTEYKKPEDYTIEELVAELFPELLANVLPLDATVVPNVEFPDASATSCSVHTLNRDSSCSVIDGDALRPMAAGPSKMASVASHSRGNRTCSEKWTTGVVYTDEELKLMAQIEREYGFRAQFQFQKR